MVWAPEDEKLELHSAIVPKSSRWERESEVSVCSVNFIALRKELQVGEEKDGHRTKGELISVDESKKLWENIVDEFSDSS